MGRFKQFAVLTRCLALAGLLSMGLGSANAQSSIEDALKQYSGDAVKGYIQPLGDLFGAAMNAGFYRSADIPATGFNLSFNIIGMAAMVGDDQKTYDAKLPAGFVPVGGSTKTATVFGGKGTTFQNSQGLQYKGSDGIINTSVFPLAAPQLTIGSLFGTQVAIRYIAVPKSVSGDEIGEISLFGIGARHSVSQYLPEFPVDLAAGIFYTKFKVGDIVDFNSLAFGAQASKSFSILTIYGGMAIESSTMNLAYKSTDPTVPADVSVSLDGANKFRITTGLAVNLFLFKVFADANFGAVTNFSGGIGFGF